MKKFLFLAALVFTVSVAWAQSIGSGERFPVDPEVRIGRLDNGLTYYIRHNAKPAGMADFYIVHNVGAIQEEDSQTGLAHFLEHLAFNGTNNLPDKTMINWLESIGVKFGSNLNAATGMDNTSYMLSQVPITRESIIDSALLILHDWSGFITLKEEEIDNERGVIIEERRTINGPMRRLMEKTSPVLYGGTRYGYRDLGGSEEQLRTFPYQELRDFYKRWYRPDLQAMIIVGDFDVDMMEAKVKKVMGDIPATVNPEPKLHFPTPDNVEPTVFVATDPELTYSNVSMYIKHRAPAPEDMDLVSTEYFDVLVSTGIGMANNRLAEIAQRVDPPFNAAAMGWSSFSASDMAFTLGVNCKENELPKAFEAIYTELERICRYGFTEPELEIAKANLLSGIENAYATRNDRRNGSFVQSYIANFTDNTPILSDEESYRTGKRFIELMDIAQIDKAFRSLITPTNNVIIAVTPDKEGVVVPETGEFLAAMERVKAVELEPYSQNTITEPLISSKIKAGKVKKESQGVFGSTLWTLKNGVRVVVKPSDLAANRVSMKAYAHGGTSMLSDEDNFTSKMMLRVLDESGLSKFTPIELSRQLAGKSASAGPTIGRFSTGMTGSSTTKDIETMLQITWLYFNEPRFDNEQFDRVMEQTRLSLKNSEATPRNKFSLELNKTMYGDDPRAEQLSTENINKVDFDRMPAIYDTFFGRTADNYTFYFIGDFDMATLKPLVEKYLGGLPTRNARLATKEDGLKRRTGIITNRFATGMEAPKSTVYYSYGGDIDFSLENVMAMSFLRECLNMRYFESIREEKGGTYGVGVGGGLMRQPNSTYQLNIQFDTDPVLVEELSEIVDAELLNIAENGPREEDMAKIAENMLTSRPEQLKQNGTWMNYLQDYYTWDQDWNTIWEQTLASMNGTKIQAMARKVLDDDNLIKLIMDPEE